MFPYLKNNAQTLKQTLFEVTEPKTCHMHNFFFSVFEGRDEAVPDAWLGKT